MKTKMIQSIKRISFIVLLTVSNHLIAQPENGQVIDEVIAVVGDEIVTKSSLETQYLQYISQGEKVTDDLRCVIMEDLLFQKLLLNQAKIDSVDVTEGQVEAEMERRLRYFIGQIGSEKALEAYYKKSIDQIKAELRESLKEQLLIQTMQDKITSDVSVTPSEVREFYNSFPKDSLPLINSEVEVAQIVRYAPITDESKEYAKERLREFKERIRKGEKLSTMAVLYSDDKGSAKKGGEIGYIGRAEVEPEFAQAAFKLKPGQVSEVFSTRYGYHIVELIDRKGEKVNVRHILIKPAIDYVGLEKLKLELDSIGKVILNDTITFTQMAQKYSEDEDSKNNGGLILNPYSGTSIFQADQLDPSLFFVIDKMEVGEISAAFSTSDQRNREGYRIIKLIKRTEPHTANLDDDYQKLKNVATQQKEQEVVQKWIKDRLETSYIKMNEKYTDCDYKNDWLKKSAQ
jgi:peptidyl-prolyl cis-trans isomerase SurA